MTAPPALLPAPPLASLEGPRAEAGTPQHTQQMRDVATRFEGLLVSQLLSVLRATAGEGGLFSGPGAEMYGQLFDQHVGDALARGGGIGLADVLLSAMDPTGASAAPQPLAPLAARTTITRAAIADRPASGADLSGATGALQEAARAMLPESGVAPQWGRDGELTQADLASAFRTEGSEGAAYFSVRDARGYAGYYKCNLFAMELARRAGFSVPVAPRRHGWGYVGPTGLTADAADGRVRGDWARVVGDESAASLDAGIVRGERAFMLTASGADERRGHMGVVERVHEIERDARGEIVRIVFDGWEGRTTGAMHLERRTWSIAGQSAGDVDDTAGARRGFGAIELLELTRPSDGESVERPLLSSAPASVRDRPDADLAPVDDEISSSGVP